MTPKKSWYTTLHCPPLSCSFFKQIPQPPRPWSLAWAKVLTSEGLGGHASSFLVGGAGGWFGFGGHPTRSPAAVWH